MLSISEEIKIIQQSTTEDERRQRVQQLQQRLHDDALQRKLRNVRLISSVERLAERASSLRQLTDRLRLIKRQYEVLATHLPDDDPGDQSQHGEPVTTLRSSQSAVSVGETHRRQGNANPGLAPGGVDVAVGASPLVEGYYDPRLAARGWQGAADPWGPASQQLGRDELGRSMESRAALLRSRIATSLTVRRAPPPPPPPGGQREYFQPPPGGHPGNYDPPPLPGGRGGNYDPPAGAVGAEGWDREWGPHDATRLQDRHTDRDAVNEGQQGRGQAEAADWDRSEPHDRSGHDRYGGQDRSEPQDHSRWDRSGPGERSSAPMRDRSVSEYSVSVPGRRRAAPPAWDGTLDGVASRWGTLERPTAADDQLQQLDRQLDRQRQLLTAAAAEEAAGQDSQQQQRQQQDEYRAPLPRLRTGSWLNPESQSEYRQSQARDPDPHFRDEQYRETDQEAHFRGDTVRFKDQDPHRREKETRFTDQDSHFRDPRESNLQHHESGDNEERLRSGPERDRQATHDHHDRDRAFMDRVPSQERHSGYETNPGQPGSGPRCADHQALHEAQQLRKQQQQEDDERRLDRDQSGYVGGDGRRLGSVSEDAELGAKEAREMGRQGDRVGSGYRREGEVRRQGSVTSVTREFNRRGSASDQDPGVRSQPDTDSQESDRGRQESRKQEQELRRQEQELRRQESQQRREEEEQAERREAERRQMEAERRQTEQRAPERKASVVSNASSNGRASTSSKGRSSRATEVSTGTQQKTASAGTGAAASRGQNGGKQTAKKKRNMDWLLEGGQSSRESDDGRSVGGSTGRPKGSAIEAGLSSENRPTAASRQSSQGSTAPARPAPTAPVPAVRRAADTSSSDEAAARPAAPAPAPAPAPAAAAAPVKLRLDSGSDSYHLSADLGGDDSDDDFWG